MHSASASGGGRQGGLAPQKMALWPGFFFGNVSLAMCPPKTLCPPTPHLLDSGSGIGDAGGQRA